MSKKITMVPNKYFGRSMEAIRNQISPLFYNELLVAVKALSATGNPTAKDIVKVNINGIINKHTNMKVKFSVIDSGYMDNNACAQIPELDGNHALLNEFIHPMISSGDSISRIIKAGNAVQGYVDLVAGKVHGVFEDIETGIYIGRSFFVKGTKFTAEETTAIILHEIGHVFTFFELLYRSTKTNFILSAALDGFFGTDDTAQRVKILAAVEKQGNTTFDAREKIAQSNNKDYVTAVLLMNQMECAGSDLGTNVYDQNASESVADQYAQRCGAGVGLATGLAKMYHFHPSRLSATTYIIWEVVKFLIWSLMVMGGGLLGIFSIIAVLTNDPTKDAYDKPEERLNRVRRDMVTRIKDKKLPPLVIKQLVADLKTIDDVLEEFKDRNTLTQFLWRNVFPWGWTQNRREKATKALEVLANNNFYVASAQLRSMSNKK